MKAPQEAPQEEPQEAPQKASQKASQEAPQEASQEAPGLLARVETKLCTVKMVRIIIVIKFVIALVTSVIVCSQILDSTEYLISHYCVLNYLEKKFLGKEDIIDLSETVGITFCHSSIALSFTPEDMRLAVNTSAGLLAALSLAACLAAPAALSGLQRRRPGLVLSWFVVTVCRAAAVTVASAVFAQLGWGRYTAMTRHPVALFMTHVGCVLLDVLTDLPVLMLYRSMTAGGAERRTEAGREDVTRFGGEKNAASGSGGTATLSVGKNKVLQEEYVAAPTVTVSVEEDSAAKDKDAPAKGVDSCAEAASKCRSQEAVEVEAEKHTASQDKRKVTSECEMKSASKDEGNAVLNVECVVASSDNKCDSVEIDEEVTVGTQTKSGSEREQEYGGTVFVLHDA